MLEKINSPESLKNLKQDEISVLAKEIRDRIISQVKDGGGHLASNLGMVESTIALHRVFNMPEDSILFDVGHQCYTHKLLTGRQDSFDTLRKMGGLSGFTNREESEYDVLTAGHSGSAMPVALGIAKANAIAGNDNWVVCVIGDGSFTNGMVYEALNNCSTEGLKLIIILNDNEMSISKNVGGISNHFTRLRNSKRYFNFKHRFQNNVSKIPLIGKALVKAAYEIKEFFKRLIFSVNLFESMGLYYMGPFNGNDEYKMELVLREAMLKDKCTLVHMVTKKGKGLDVAENKPESYHFAGGTPSTEATFSSMFGCYMLKKASENEKVCAVTAAMDQGTGLSKYKEKYPDRFIDVGIAEECAVSICSGLAIGGKLPVLSIYSTFMQRTFDQLLEDVSLQKVHMVLTIDRAGLVSGDGVTHQGIWDVPMLSMIPDITLYSPCNFYELEECLNNAFEGDGLQAVRYPKGQEIDLSEFDFTYDGAIKKSGSGDIVIITYGRITKNAAIAAKQVGAKVVSLTRVLPLPVDELLNEIKDAKLIYLLEEGFYKGGIGEQIAALISENYSDKNVFVRAIDEFVPHGKVSELERHCHLDAESIINEIETLYRRKD